MRYILYQDVMSILPTHLRYFLETVRLGSIRKASSHLNISPSAIYRSIQNIEFDLGTQLLERSSKGVTATPAGRILFGYAERVFADGEHAIDRIKTLAQRDISISVAGPDGIVPEILSTGFEALLQNYPEVSTLFRGCSGSEASAYLEAGTVDLALVFDHQPGETVEVFYERRLPLGFVVPPDHPLCLVDSATLDAGCDWPLILPDGSWPMRTLLNHEFSRRGLTPEIRAVTSSIRLMKHLVIGGHGIGIQTRIGLVDEIKEGQLMHVPLGEDHTFDRTLHLMCRNDIPVSKHTRFLAEEIARRIQAY